VPDPRFSYEQEAAPEAFFTPYIWLVVHERSGIRWEPARIVLLADEAGAGGEEPDDGLPALMAGFDLVSDVDESATVRTGPVF